MIDILKSVVLGIVEGITEWLPISSTGHMIIANDIMKTDTGFFGSQLYLYVIQLGAILAVATLYFKKLNPFAPSKTKEEKNDTWQMWFKVIAACLPAAAIGLVLNDFMDSISTPVIVSIMLIIYGIGFILVERRNRKPEITAMNKMSYKTALIIGAFQVLSLVPGTSRSGSTILGAILVGCSRDIAAEFSFFLAIPVMFGVSFLKIVTNDVAVGAEEIKLLIIGMVVAYVLSLAALKFLTGYVKKHDFKVFGYYRIILGIIVILWSII